MERIVGYFSIELMDWSHDQSSLDMPLSHSNFPRPPIVGQIYLGSALTVSARSDLRFGIVLCSHATGSVESANKFY
jgi:hypothetical protein